MTDWTFQVKTADNRSLPELYVRIDKEPEDGQITTTHDFGGNDFEESIAFYQAFERIYLADNKSLKWFNDPISGTGILQSAKRHWILTDIVPIAMNYSELDHSDNDQLEISITWKFQRAELM